MSLVEEIRQYWGWVGIEPVEVVGENDFGNLIIKDEDGKFWRMCPEDCYCKVIAANRAELDSLSINREFLQDWYMSELVSLAKDQCGPLTHPITHKSLASKLQAAWMSTQGDGSGTGR